MLHPSLEPALAQLPADRPVALLTRHSLRELTDANGMSSYTLPLTEAGIVLAEQWGARLGRRIHAFHSSPVGRCVETAQAMARGAGLELPVAMTLQLVEPGCYVHNIRKVGPLFLEMGPLAFANFHLRERVEGLLSPRDGAGKLLQHLQATQGDAGSLTVHVTHDTILAAFVYHLLGRDHIGEDDWPWMMEGLWLWFEPEHVCWLWRGQEGRATLADYWQPSQQENHD